MQKSFKATILALGAFFFASSLVLSAQTALEATQTGLEVGTRTIVDVLINEQQLFSAQRDYARARNNFVVNGLLLRQAAGTIQASDVAAVNTLLVSDAEAALDVAPDAGDAAMPGLPTVPGKIAAPGSTAAPASDETPKPAKKKKPVTADVELVTAEDDPSALKRRDYMLLAVGAGVVLGIVLVVLLLIWLLQ